MTDADARPLALGVRWLQTVPETLGFCALLCFVYAAELLVWTYFGLDAVVYWFVADTSPSPGWILSPLAHSPADPFHLLSNVALLLVFGGMAERRLSRRSYLGFVLAAGLGGLAGQLFWYAIAPTAVATPGTLGASVIALAATTFVVVDGLRRRRATGQWPGDTTWIWLLSGGLIVARRLVLDLGLGVPNVGRYGHLWGILFGAVLALVYRDTGGEAN